MLIGTASTWFLLDIAYYSQNLFLPNILEGIGYNPSIALPAAKCMKMHNCPHYSLPVSFCTAGHTLHLCLAIKHLLLHAASRLDT